MRKFLVLVMALVAPGCVQEGSPDGNNCIKVCTLGECSMECEDRLVLYLVEDRLEYCVDHSNPVDPDSNWVCYEEEPEGPSCDLLTLEYTTLEHDLDETVAASPCQAPRNECAEGSSAGRSVMETLGGCFVPVHYRVCLGGSSLLDVLNGSLCN